MFEHFRIEMLIIQVANFLANLEIAATNFLANVVDQRIDDVQSDIADQTDQLTAHADQNTETILDAIAQAALQSALDADAMESKIIGVLTGVIEKENRDSTAAIGQILRPIGQQVAGIDNALSVFSSNVETGLNTSNNILGNILNVLAGGLNATIVNNINIDKSIFDFVVGQVATIVASSQEQNAGVLKNLGDTFGNIVEGLIAVLIEEQRRKNPELVAIAEAILHNKDRNTKVIEQAADESAEGLGGAIIQSVIEKIAPQLEITGDDLRRSLGAYLGGPNAFDCFEDTSEDDTFDVRDVTAWSKTIIDVFIEVLAYIALPVAMTAAQTQAKMNTYNVCNPSLVLPIAESIMAQHRGLLSNDQTAVNLRAHGYTPEDADLLIQVGQSIPDITFLYNMWYRDLIDDDGLDFSLKALGFAQGFIEPLKELAFFIPPVQDIITMAVREVFSPEIARAQGQFDDFPEEFANFAKQQGVSRKWAENYWAAHWSLPSVQMGYEMLHRGVITEKELNNLLRALDVMPGWRDKLIEISYRPFTRVDIRRMHRVGVLSDGDVKLAYLNLGYDDTNAQLLQDFVVEINKDDELVTLDVASDLTRSSILGFYVDGIINSSVATALLIQSGINVAAAELIILGADFDIERRDRKQQLTIILDQFRFGGLSFEEAADRIRGLEFEPRERELAMLDLEALAIRETKLPSKTDLDKFLKAELVTEDEYLAQLDRIGYPVVWAEKYLALINKGGAANA
ncbi:MAG: hypothetical protein ACE5OQ_11540 [Woeseia sp.]